MLWMHGVIAAPSLLAVSLLRRRRRPLEREAVGAGCGSHDFLSGGSGHSEWRASASAEAHQWCRRRPFFRSGLSGMLSSVVAAVAARRRWRRSKR
ncbi:hypothetical protein DAI22_01g177900 [Oryza sativa Japonica Group]|nr:hypothetical protein DAI22_01g177900 [Oryza sativa Japonica Group]